MEGDTENPKRSLKRVGKSRPSAESVPVSETASHDIAAARTAAASHRREIETSRLLHDLEMERDDARLRRRREWTLTIAALVLGAIVCFVCLLVFTLPRSSESLKDKALTSRIGLMTASVGFLVGKSVQKP